MVVADERKIAMLLTTAAKISIEQHDPQRRRLLRGRFIGTFCFASFGGFASPDKETQHAITSYLHCPTRSMRLSR